MASRVDYDNRHDLPLNREKRRLARAYQILGICGRSIVLLEGEENFMQLEHPAVSCGIRVCRSFSDHQADLLVTGPDHVCALPLPKNVQFCLTLLYSCRIDWCPLYVKKVMHSTSDSNATVKQSRPGCRCRSTPACARTERVHIILIAFSEPKPSMMELDSKVEASGSTLAALNPSRLMGGHGGFNAATLTGSMHARSFSLHLPARFTEFDNLRLGRLGGLYRRDQHRVIRGPCRK